jgi:hypothetical protein
MTNVNGPFPFPDALQEFSVQTSNYNAEFGQSAGAVVNIVTKSGTEKFHGDAFEFLRNGYFDAKPYFATMPTPCTDTSLAAPSAVRSSSPTSPPGQSTQFFFGYQHTLYHLNSTPLNDGSNPRGRRPHRLNADYADCATRHPATRSTVLAAVYA